LLPGGASPAIVDLALARRMIGDGDSIGRPIQIFIRSSSATPCRVHVPYRLGLEDVVSRRRHYADDVEVDGRHGADSPMPYATTFR
jgi:hypothetical protein